MNRVEKIATRVQAGLNHSGKPLRHHERATLARALEEIVRRPWPGDLGQWSLATIVPAGADRRRITLRSVLTKGFDRTQELVLEPLVVLVAQCNRIEIPDVSLAQQSEEVAGGGTGRLMARSQMDPGVTGRDAFDDGAGAVARVVVPDTHLDRDAFLCQHGMQLA